LLFVDVTIYVDFVVMLICLPEAARQGPLTSSVSIRLSRESGLEASPPSDNKSIDR